VVDFLAVAVAIRFGISIFVLSQVPEAKKPDTLRPPQKAAEKACPVLPVHGSSGVTHSSLK
jgi:hypothetical protein